MAQLHISTIFMCLRKQSLIKVQYNPPTTITSIITITKYFVKKLITETLKAVLITHKLDQQTLIELNNIIS